MPDQNAVRSLKERFQRATSSPPLMMLYPPVSGGRPFEGSTEDLWRGVDAGEATLYVHVPFCRTRCIFCPFHATVAPPEDYGPYVDALLAEASMHARHLEACSFSSVYFGGGTPSVLPPDLLRRLLDGLRGRLRIDGADISLEASPSTIDAGKLRALREAGVTRLSLGVQSFDAKALAGCGRDDRPADVLRSLDAALAAGFRDVNIDLMYGLPGQTLPAFLGDLRIAAGRAVPGVTLYAAVYLPALAQRARDLGCEVPTEDDKHEFYGAAYDFLTANGYPQRHFGAGAFLRGGLNAHRRNVAHGAPTIGIGTWAYSSTGVRAWQNLAPREAWAETLGRGRPPIATVLEVDEEERPRKWAIEALLLAFLDRRLFERRFGETVEARFPAELEALLDLGLIEDAADEIRLTREGGRHLREIRYVFASEKVVEAMESGRLQGL
ncbi:MAG: radical SAM family heme chaperone HemW [Planctomycetota bacterium]